MSQPRRVAIVGSNRIPFARANGPYAHAGNQAMLTAALEGLIRTGPTRTNANDYRAILIA